MSRLGFGSGTVTSDPAGIDCGGTCSSSFDYNQIVTLTADPAPGSFFDSWGGDCSGTALTCEVTMTVAKSVTATFTTTPLAFNKTSPSDGQTGLSTTVSLLWDASSGASSYEYCFDTSDDDACSTWTDVGTDTSVNLVGLTLLETYYWHVRAVNDDGTTYSNGDSTTYWSFTCSGTDFVPAGMYDDNDPDGAGGTLIDYTGNWGLTNNSDYYMSTYHSTAANLATAELDFYGTKVNVYFSKGANRGSFNVYIDDVLWGSIDQYYYMAENGWVWYSGYIDNDTNPNNVLLAANHTIKLEFISAGPGSTGLIDAIEVEDLPEPPVVGSEYYDDISKDVIITGNWLRKYPVISAYKSTTHETTDTDASISLTWFAKRPMLLYPLHPLGGLVDVYLDGVYYATINQKSPDFMAYQGQHWTISPSFDPPGEHTIEFRLAPGQSPSTRMYIDAIVVPAAVRRTAGVYDDHDLGFFFTGQWLAKGGPTSPYFMQARHQTSVGNSMMKNTVTGNRVCLIYPGGTDRGLGRVDIDGLYYATINEYWPSLRFNMVWCSDELALSAGGNDDHSVAFFFIPGQQAGLQLFIDGLMVFDKIVVSTNGTYDDRDPEVVFTDFWLPTNDPVTGAYQETIYETQSQDAKAKFYFDDGTVTFQYQQGPQGGLVDIYIDGVYETTINQYNATTQQGTQWTMSSSLPAGEHYIEVRLASGQSNKSLYVDAFILGD